MKGILGRLCLGKKFKGMAAIAAIASLLSCEPEQVESPLLVFLSPQETLIETNSNDHLFIRVESRSQVGSRLMLKVESIDVLRGVQPVFDSTFNFKKINYLLDYVVPAYPDSTETILVFTLINDDGDQIQVAKRLLINKGAASIKETSGHVMYSSLSAEPNAFSIAELTPAYLADSLKRSLDILDGSTKQNNGDGSLSRTWYSRTNLNFVKFSGFNYADANAVTITNAYNSGVKLSTVNNIRDSDIIIVGRGKEAIGAIQVVAVTDAAGYETDKYTFSIKKLIK